MINNPELWFLDEPTTGLDPAIAANIKDIIKAQTSRGVTSFLTTHNMYIAEELCDRVAFITDGKIDLIDSPQKLKVNNGENKLSVEYHQHGKMNLKQFSLDNLGENKEFMDIIKQYRIETIHSQEATLEDVFIKTTGKRLI